MIQVESLSRYYGKFCAVNDVSFRIEANTVVGFLGCNGAGKSTTLKVLVGLLSPSMGTVKIGDVDLSSAPVSFRSQVGFLPENPPLHLEMRATEFLAFVGRLRGMDEDILRERIPEVIHRCRLSGYQDRVIGELSHGYRKRVGIAQAILHKPSLVILDEPFGGLDPVQGLELVNVVRDLKAESTVLVSSHFVSWMSQLCDRILVVRDGQLPQDCDVEMAPLRSRTMFSLVGDESAIRGFFDARPGVHDLTILQHTAETVDLTVRLDGTSSEDVVAGLIGAGFGVRRVGPAEWALEKMLIDRMAPGDET